jgi:hypothetical protein
LLDEKSPEVHRSDGAKRCFWFFFFFLKSLKKKKRLLPFLTRMSSLLLHSLKSCEYYIVTKARLTGYNCTGLPVDMLCAFMAWFEINHQLDLKWRMYLLCTTRDEQWHQQQQWHSG